MQAAGETVAEILSEADRVRYMSSLYAPEGVRSYLQALYAFHAEITRIPDLVSEPMPGEIRLQWWRDLLTGGTSTETAGHPVALALGQAINECHLPPNVLLAMIDARAASLYADPFLSRTDFEAYCGETASSLFQLAAMIVAGGTVREIADASGHGGCAYEITRLLARISVDRRQGRCTVPVDILTSIGMDAGTLINAEAGQGHERAIAAMIALAREHFSRFRAAMKNARGELAPVFLPMSVVEGRLRRMEKMGLELFSLVPRNAPVREHLFMLRRSLKGW